MKFLPASSKPNSSKQKQIRWLHYSLLSFLWQILSKKRFSQRNSRLFGFLTFFLILILFKPTKDYQVAIAQTSCPNLLTGEFDGTFGTTSSFRDLESPPPVYTYGPGNGGGIPAGTYIVTANNNSFNSQNWNSFGRRIEGNTTGASDDAFLLVNGNTNVGTFYEQTVNVQTNRDINVSVDARNWSGASSDQPAQRPTIALRIFASNGTTLLGQAIASDIASADGWVEVSQIVNTGANSQIVLRLQNLSTQSNGNDFAIDNFSVSSTTTPCLQSGADSGDAPLDGNTAPNGGTTGYGTASHIIVSGTQLGNNIDADITAQSSANADGDDSDSDGDDEDGITIPASLTAGQTATITANVSGTGGYLQGWIDWNGDGTFDAGEQVANNIQDDETGDAANTTAGTISFNVNVPAGAITTAPTFARFRWSTTQGLNTTTTANDGEVEDYQVAIAASTPVATVTCPTESQGTGSGYATSGTGAYKDDIFWLDWSCGTTTQFSPGDIVQKTWTAPNGIEITAIVSNITEILAPYNTGDWQGDKLDELYGGLNPIGLQNQTDGADPTYDVTFSMTLNGVPIPADIVTAEAEDTGFSNESVTWTTNGTPWQPLEIAPSSSLNVTFSNGGQTIFMDDVPQAGGGTLLALTENVSSISVDMKAGGKEAIAFGIMTPFDFGDANGYPDSEGHLARRTATGGSQPTTPTPVNNLTMATLENDSPYLGSVGPDIDRAENSDQPTVDADGDDQTKLDDEDGINLPGITAGDTDYTIPVGNITTNTIGAATLHAWVDFNQNSDFEPGEYKSTTINNGTPSGDLEWSGLSGITAGTTYARFRITTDSNINDTTPYAGAIDGEMEDYAVAIAAAPIDPALCPVTSFLIQKNPSELSIYNLATGQFSSSSPISGVDSNTILNAVGFNLLDGNMYALEDGSNANKDLYRLTIGGNATKLGTISDLDQNSYNAGDVDSNGYYYVSSTSLNTVEIIDVNPARTATYGKKVGEVTLPSGAGSGPDLAINPVDGRLYTINFTDKRLWSFEIDVATQTVSNFTDHGGTTNAANGAVTSITAGAVYFDVDGNFYTYNNDNGDLWKFPTSPTVSTAGELIGNGVSAPLNDGARCAFASVSSSSIANLVLLKRITAINPGQTDQTLFSTFEDDTNDDRDEKPGWPSDKNAYLPGKVKVDNVKPGDEVEYTIYFLSDGAKDAHQVQICDVIADEMTFVKNTYGVEVGIGLSLTTANPPTTNPPALQLSNVIGDETNNDQGEFYGPGTTPPVFCDKPDPNDPNNPPALIDVDSNNNVSGAVLVNIQNPLPPATSPGDPVGSYGFIRFRAKVK